VEVSIYSRKWLLNEPKVVKTEIEIEGVGFSLNLKGGKITDFVRG
jgi:hypothetical protein